MNFQDVRTIVVQACQDKGLVDSVCRIVNSNIEQNRMAYALEKGRFGSFEAYITHVTQSYECSYKDIDAIQIERSDACWQTLFAKLDKWTHSELYRMGFDVSDRTHETAHGHAVLAAEHILTSTFPYDVPFDAWAHRLVQYVCYQEARKSRTQKRGYGKQVFSLDSDDRDMLPSNFDLAEKTADGLDLIQAVEQLTELRKEVIVLHYGEGLSFEEIANQMNKTKSAVYSLHFTALNQLRSNFGGNLMVLLLVIGALLKSHLRI